MTSLRQIEANRRNALRSTGPISQEGKERSRRNAVRHGLTAETVIGALEDAQDYAAFEATVIADYDAQSAVERELVLRLASLLWRLRRSTAMETGLHELQARELLDNSNEDRPGHASYGQQLATQLYLKSEPFDPAVELARCFVGLMNRPNYPLDRLNRYEVMLWRQVGQVLFTLNNLERCKPQERRRF
jgi:hypothetical protein